MYRPFRIWQIVLFIIFTFVAVVFVTHLEDKKLRRDWMQYKHYMDKPDLPFEVYKNTIRRRNSIWE